MADHMFVKCRVLAHVPIPAAIFVCPFPLPRSFYKRSLLCKSLVWSCAYTGKGHLTFSEASKSEEDSRRQVESLPAPVKRAVLEVIHHCQRTSLWQLFEELWMLFKDRYWEEEQVEATVDKRRWVGQGEGHRGDGTGLMWESTTDPRHVFCLSMCVC